jgi:hypothetical protein
MVEKLVIPGANIVEFSRYQQCRSSNGKAKAMRLSARICRHCGAGLLDGESEDDCSSTEAARRSYAD